MKKISKAGRIVIVFKTIEHYRAAINLIGSSCGTTQAYPTTTFDERELSMTIERGQLLPTDRPGMFCELCDSFKGKLTIDARKIRVFNTEMNDWKMKMH